MKNIEPYFGQIYAEVGVNFGEILPWNKTLEWADAIKKHLKPRGLLLSKYKDYQLGFIMTSSVMIRDVQIKGPRKGRKNKFLEYAIWIPYGEVVSSQEPLTKLTECFKQGISEILSKLEYPDMYINKFLARITDSRKE